jgi:hypothetical protein
MEIRFADMNSAILNDFRNQFPFFLDTRAMMAASNEGIFCFLPLYSNLIYTKNTEIKQTEDDGLTMNDIVMFTQDDQE